jgi:hypothetical protein
MHGHLSHRCKVTGKYLCSIVAQREYLGNPLDEVDAYMHVGIVSIVERRCIMVLVPSLDLGRIISKITLVTKQSLAAAIGGDM